MDKLDKLIQIIKQLKEDAVVGGGAPTNNISSGNIVKYDHVMGFTRRNRPTIIAKGKMQGSRTRWKEGLR